MALPDSGGSDKARPLDVRALERVQRRLQAAAQPPWLHGEVARRMAERLPFIKMQPAAVADWEAFLGASQPQLRERYPRARLLAVEHSATRLGATAEALAQPWWSPRRWAGAAAQAMDPDAVTPGQVQLVWANMGLHGAAEPLRRMRQWHRALAVDGFLMFSTLGPGTLNSLQALYRAKGWPSPLAPFVDMHDLGDMLIEAGFADPVMDQETITLTWATPEELLAELRQLGGNLALDRYPGLRTPRWRQQLLQALRGLAGPDGRLGLDFEIVYGHAFKPLPRARLAAETQVPLADLRAMVKSGRRSDGRG
ncbi:biotin synthase [Rubrivivax rivuli]|uniref:Biotin synthase n=1 Tax=Rubrivivax rivuli TaxID=1862385 RepID=A0A437RM63_9BURK|nr:biotin synthase [Rubrivivax rivuli]RVU47702.1 biotin synthase [Rubrivivax rivuli]